MIKQFGILTFSLLIGTTLSFAQPTSTSKNKQHLKVQNTMLMTTVGTHEHGRSPTPYAESLQKQNNFYQDFNQQRSKHFLFWNYQHPAEQHLTNLYASLPKAIMLAGCIDHKSCSALFDKPVTP